MIPFGTTRPFPRTAIGFLETNLAESFFQVDFGPRPIEANLLSEDHFSVDGTLIEAWASMKSVRPKDQSQDDPPNGNGRNQAVDFRGQKRKNETHGSSTDPEAKMFRKGTGKEGQALLHGPRLD